MPGPLSGLRVLELARILAIARGRVTSLVRHGATGFLFANDVSHWASFLAELPPRDRLHEMGKAAAATRLQSWDDTADAYLAHCRRLLPLDSGIQE